MGGEQFSAKAFNGVKKYCDAGWGIYDITPEYDRCIAMADAYYGDSDKMARRCATLGKPVMLQNVEL